MRNKKEKSMSNNFQEYYSKLNSWKLVQRNGWAIKISIITENSIVILFASQYTGQSILRYCSTEDDALEIINTITARNARELIDLGY